MSNMDPRYEPAQPSHDRDSSSIIVSKDAFHHEEEGDSTRIFETPKGAEAAMDEHVASMIAEFSKRERAEAVNELKSMIEDHAAKLSEGDEDLSCLEAALEAVEGNDPGTARTWLQNLDESPEKGMMLGQLATWEKKLKEAN